MPAVISARRIDDDFREDLIKLEQEASNPGVLPRVFDFSMSNQFLNCKRLGFYGTLMHLTPPAPAHPLSFGSAIHKGLETMYKFYLDRADVLMTCKRTKPLPEFHALREELVFKPAKLAFIEEARKDPTLPYLISEEAKYRAHSIERGLSLLRKYLEVCPITEWGESLWKVESSDHVEMGFAIIISGVWRGERDVIFVGKIDLLVRMLAQGFFGKLAVVDHKTTQRLTEWWGDQWKIHHQLTGYIKGARELTGEDVRHGIINALYFNKNIEEVNLHYPTSRSDEDFLEWEQEIIQLVEEIEEKWMLWQKIAQLPGGITRARMSQDGMKKVIDSEDAHRALSGEALTIWGKNPGHCFAYKKACPMFTMCIAKGVEQRVLAARKAYQVKQWLPFEQLSERGIGVV
jgi:hypothetical protein